MRPEALADPLCGSLCDLCASVVSIFPSNFTTEAQWTSPDYVDTLFRLPHSRSVAHIATDLSNQESNDDADGCTRLRCTQRWPCVQLPAWATRADRATPI